MIFFLQVNTESGLSPGHFTEEYAATAAKNRKRKQAISHLPSTKRRRLILKKERAINQGAYEALEGQSYQSGILFSALKYTIYIGILSSSTYQTSKKYYMFYCIYW